MRAMFGAALAKVFNAQLGGYQLQEARGEPEFAVTRLRAGPDPVASRVSLPVDDALLVWVSLTPTAIGQWRAQYNGRSVGVTRPLAFATTALDLRRSTQMWSRGPFDSLHYFLAGSFMQRVASENELSTAQDLRAAFFVEDLVVAQLTRSILLPAWRGDSFDSLALDQIAMVLGAHILQRYCSSTRAGTSANRGLQTWQRIRAEEMLRARLDGSITLRDLATACSLSVSHFARGFRRSFGVSAHQYLIRLRLERAKALLASSTRPLAEIAHLCGFCDQSALTRAFARVERMTPSLWRRCNS